MRDKHKLRDDMNYLHGQLEALKFPLVWKSEVESQAYYDLIDSIVCQFEQVKSEALKDG